MTRGLRVLDSAAARLDLVRFSRFEGEAQTLDTTGSSPRKERAHHPFGRQRLAIHDGKSPLRESFPVFEATAVRAARARSTKFEHLVPDCAELIYPSLFTARTAIVILVCRRYRYLRRFLISPIGKIAMGGCFGRIQRTNGLSAAKCVGTTIKGKPSLLDVQEEERIATMAG